MEQQHRQGEKDEKDGQRSRDPRERDELERVTGDAYMDAPAADGDEAASDDAPLREAPVADRGEREAQLGGNPGDDQTPRDGRGTRV
jgi:hypothetical protein